MFMTRDLLVRFVVSCLLGAPLALACRSVPVAAPCPTEGALAASPAGLPRVLPDPLTAADAQRLCRELAAAVAAARCSNPAQADAVFAPIELPEPTGPTVSVMFRGVRFLLPAREYRCIPGWDRGAKHFDLTLFDAARRELVLLSAAEGAPLLDAFAITGDERSPDPERLAYTERVFGHAPTLFEIESIAYGLRARDFACDPARLVGAVREAYALVLKPGLLVSDVRAFRGVGVPESHGVVGQTRDGRHDLQYSFRHGNSRGTLAVSAGDAVLVEETLALLPFAGDAKDLTEMVIRPLDPVCAAVVELAAEPSIKRARDLRARVSVQPGNEALVAALDFYLEE